MKIGGNLLMERVKAPLMVDHQYHTPIRAESNHFVRRGEALCDGLFTEDRLDGVAYR